MNLTFLVMIEIIGIERERQHSQHTHTQSAGARAGSSPFLTPSLSMYPPPMLLLPTGRAISPPHLGIGRFKFKHVLPLHDASVCHAQFVSTRGRVEGEFVAATPVNELTNDRELLWILGAV